MTSRSKPLKLMILLPLSLAIVFVGLLEATLRFTPLGDALVEGDLSLEPPRYLVVREWLPNTKFSFSPPRIRRDNPGGKVLDVYDLVTDQAGFIRPGRTHERPDLTVAFVGGSTTECLYVQPELRFPYLTGVILEERLGIKVNTLNAGKSGNNTMHSTLQLIAKIIPEKPDVVVIMNNANDGGVLDNQKSYWNRHGDYRIVNHIDRSIERGIRTVRDALVPYSYRALKRAKRRLSSMLLAVAAPVWPGSAHAGAIDRDGGAAIDADDARRQRVERAGTDYEHAMRQFVATAQAWGIRAVVLSQPTLNEGAWHPGDDAKADYLGRARERAGLSFADFKNRHAYFDAIAREVAQREGAIHLDLANSREWTSNELYDGMHFTDAGSRHVATFLATGIANALGMDSPSTPSRP